MFEFRLQPARITKRKAWKRSKGGRLQRPRRPAPLKRMPQQKKQGVQPSPHYAPAASPDIEEAFSPPLSATLSEFLPAYAGEDIPPFDATQFSLLHPMHPPPRYRHQIVQYFIGTNPMKRPRVVPWSSRRKKRNPKFMELTNSLSLLTKTISYLDTLIREERARIAIAMEEVRGLGGDLWRGRWCAGFGEGGEEMVGLVKEDVYVYEGDLLLAGDFWAEKRRVVLKCAVLEELVCLAQEIEGVVGDVRGVGEEYGEKEYGEKWYRRFWRERTF